MLAPAALIVQTIFLEADTNDVVSVDNMEQLLILPMDEVNVIIRYVSPFMTNQQKTRVRTKILQVAQLTDKPTPNWLSLLTV